MTRGIRYNQESSSMGLVPGLGEYIISPSLPVVANFATLDKPRLLGSLPSI
jgi:hypothetical protein